jgi:hypothetical protein
MSITRQPSPHEHIETADAASMRLSRVSPSAALGTSCIVGILSQFSKRAVCGSARPWECRDLSGLYQGSLGLGPGGRQLTCGLAKAWREAARTFRYFAVALAVATRRLCAGTSWSPLPVPSVE